MWQLYFANLHACAQLKKLAVVNNAYGGGDLQQINPEVRKMPLRELDLSGNRLYREDMFPVEEEREREAAFVELLGTLGECKTLGSLSLTDMNFVFMWKIPEDIVTIYVLRLMLEVPLFKTLNLSKNQITPEVKTTIQGTMSVTLELTLSLHTHARLSLVFVWEISMNLFHRNRICFLLKLRHYKHWKTCLVFILKELDTSCTGPAFAAKLCLTEHVCAL